jgi:hypothetical protein
MAVVDQPETAFGNSKVCRNHCAEYGEFPDFVTASLKLAHESEICQSLKLVCRFAKFLQNQRARLGR